jgi:hypothetical protein
MVKKYIIYSIFCCLICFVSNAQKTLIQLSKVDSTGFCAIRITPTIASYFLNEMSDIRLLNDKNQQVPFAVRQKGISKNNTAFKTLPIIDNASDSNTSTLLVKNLNKQDISSFHLQIKNNNVKRIAQLTGSNDLKNWFAIAENMLLIGKENINTTTYNQTISFPSNNYLYFKLTILNGNKNALSIENVFIDSTALSEDVEPSFIENPSCNFFQKDSGKYSIISVSQQEAYHIYALQLKGVYSPYIDRTAEVFVGNKLVGNFPIRHENVFSFLPEFQAERFLIRIFNGDNSPIKFTDVNTFQRNTEIVALFNKNENYHLQIQSGLTEMPNYELAKFVDSIPLQLPTLKDFSYSTIEDKIVETKSNNKLYMWLAIVVVVIVLGALTYKLVKEIK